MESLSRVPAELRKLLFDLTLSYIVNKPSDYIQHGFQYFEKLHNRNRNMNQGNVRFNVSFQESSESSGSACSILPPISGRRQTVFAEKYDPEEDDEIDPVIPKSDEERQILSFNIEGVLILRVLDKESKATIMDAMHARDVSAGEVIIEQGSTDASYFYVIQEGIFEALVNIDGEMKVVRTYNNVGSFGELALLYNVPRAATVRAVTDGRLWELGRLTFRRIVLRYAFNKRERYQKLFDEVEFLKELSSYAKLDLADSLIPKYYEDGEDIFLQGDVADGMYFVESGQVNVIFDHPSQGRIVVNELYVGDYFGELALITHNRRALTAIACGETKVAFLDKDTFERLLGPCTDILTRHFSDYDAKMKAAVGSSHSLFTAVDELSPESEADNPGIFMDSEDA